MSDMGDIEIVEDGDLGPMANPEEYLADLPSRLMSSVLGFMGFSTASLFGIFAGNPGLIILTRAMVAMVVCALIGRALGSVGEICVREFLDHYKAERPVPEKPSELVELDQAKMAHESLVSSMKKAA